jgi:hypothetical protein
MGRSCLILGRRAKTDEQRLLLLTQRQSGRSFLYRDGSGQTSAEADRQFGFSAQRRDGDQHEEVRCRLAR